LEQFFSLAKIHNRSFHGTISRNASFDISLCNTQLDLAIENLEAVFVTGTQKLYFSVE